MSHSTYCCEIWADVPGYEGHYQASDLGSVRSVDRSVTSVLGVTQRLRGRVLIQTLGRRDGRLTVKLSRAGRPRTRLVHQLVLAAFRGPRPDGLFGCHENGDPLDNRLVNLRWDTPSSNSQDMLRHGNSWGQRKTHCPRQHLLVSPNLVASRIAKGHRVCLACARARALQQRTSGAFDLQVASDRYYAEIVSTA